jgi:hypothetical protein
MTTSDFKGQHDAVRAVKLALLKIQAEQTIQRTDASARKVEYALARVASAMTDELIIPAISSIAAELQSEIGN